MKLSFVIVGGGKVGTSLGRQLTAVGYRPFGVTARTLESARKAATIVGTEKVAIDPWEITTGVDVVFITTPDGAIASVCDDIQAHGGFSPGTTVLHCSGSLPSTILNVGNTEDVAVGSLHPLQSFAAVDPAVNPFKGIVAAIEGQDRAVLVAREAGEALGATCFPIRTEAKTLYHAAAVVASNYLVTLVDVALKFLETAGIGRQDGFQLLSPLINGTLTNIEHVGIPDALTGPIARGDTETVNDHLQAIHKDLPNLEAVYRQLGRCTINIAKDKGTLSENDAAVLRQILIAHGLTSG